MQADSVRDRQQQLQDLLRQHRQLRQEFAPHAQTLISLEHRIRWYLITLAWMRDDLASIPAEQSLSSDEAFIELATRWLSPSQDIQQTATGLARQWLQAGGEMAAGSLRAMLLFPQANRKEDIEDLYMALPEQRVALVNLWTRQKQCIPDALLNHAGQSSQPVALQQAAMTYRAFRPEYDADYFTGIYSAAGKQHRADAVIRAAVFAALVRGDIRAAQFIPKALEAGLDENAIEHWMTLLALSGSEKLWPLLRQYLEQRPQQGLYLLGVYARPVVVAELLEYLGQPRYAQQAMLIWQLLTGHKLNQRPRLALVGEPVATGAGDDAGLIPDQQSAQLWWEQMQASWHNSQRFHQGLPVITGCLAETVCQYGGRFGQLLQDWLSVLVQEPVNCGAEGWQLGRQAMVTAIADADIKASGLQGSSV
jgi:hypothetical protein